SASPIARGVAAVSDSTTFILAQGESCPGGYCVYLTSDYANTWTKWGTTYEGLTSYFGASAIAYDPQTQFPAFLQDNGQVVLIQQDQPGTYTLDYGLQGLSNTRPRRVAAWNGVPWIIADDGNVYRFSGYAWSGAWEKVGDLGGAAAADISLDWYSG